MSPPVRAIFTHLILTSLLALAAACRHDTSATEPVASDGEQRDWVTSSDGLLMLRIVADNTIVKPNDCIVLIAELKNSSERSLAVLRPFGDHYHVRASCMLIEGPSGPLTYMGPTPGYSLSAKAFARLAPGAVIRDRLELTVDNFPGSDAPGKYKITFQYEVEDGYRKTAMDRGFTTLWLGNVKSKPIHVMKQ